jgi:hypothetical protein
LGILGTGRWNWMMGGSCCYRGGGGGGSGRATVCVRRKGESFVWRLVVL